MHPLAAAVTVIAPIMAADESFVAINEGILSSPLPARPICVFVFTHEKVLPATVPVKTMEVKVDPLHTA